MYTIVIIIVIISSQGTFFFFNHFKVLHLKLLSSVYWELRTTVN